MQTIGLGVFEEVLDVSIDSSQCLVVNRACDACQCPSSNDMFSGHFLLKYVCCYVIMLLCNTDLIHICICTASNFHVFSNPRVTMIHELHFCLAIVKNNSVIADVTCVLSILNFFPEGEDRYH